MNIQHIIELIKNNIKIESIDIINIKCLNEEKPLSIELKEIDYPDFDSFTDR